MLPQRALAVIIVRAGNSLVQRVILSVLTRLRIMQLTILVQRGTHLVALKPVILLALMPLLTRVLIPLALIRVQAEILQAELRQHLLPAPTRLPIVQIIKQQRTLVQAGTPQAGFKPHLSLALILLLMLVATLLVLMTLISTPTATSHPVFQEITSGGPTGYGRMPVARTTQRTSSEIELRSVTSYGADTDRSPAVRETVRTGRSVSVGMNASVARAR